MQPHRHAIAPENLADAGIPLRRLPSPTDYRAGRAAGAPQPSPNWLAPGYRGDDTYVELGTPGDSLLRGAGAPGHSAQASIERPAWRTLYSAARSGTLEDWTYWQHHGEHYRRALAGVVLVGIWAGLGVGGYFFYRDLQDQGRAGNAGASGPSATG